MIYVGSCIILYCVPHHMGGRKPAWYSSRRPCHTSGIVHEMLHSRWIMIIWICKLWVALHLMRLRLSLMLGFSEAELHSLYSWWESRRCLLGIILIFLNSNGSIKFAISFIKGRLNYSNIKIIAYMRWKEPHHVGFRRRPS